MRRFVLIGSVLSVSFATVASANSADSANAATTTAQFVTGTTAAIPAGTLGSLDASSPAELRFHYRKEVFALPYPQITGTEVSDPVGRHIWHVPVPKLGKTTRLLTISYQDGGKPPATMAFKATSSAVSRLVETIDERRKGPERAGVAPMKAGPEEWWGDKYWRTNHNKSKWPSLQADSPLAPVGTKESSGTKE